MTDTQGPPVFSLARHREIVAAAVERTRREEREKIAAAIEVSAHSFGGAVGVALLGTAAQIRGAVAAPAIDMSAMGENDPAYNYAIEFAALTPEQRQRRLARHAKEMQEATERHSRQQREENERIERERAALKASGYNPDEDAPPGSENLPPMREHDDETSALALVRFGRRGGPVE